MKASIEKQHQVHFLIFLRSTIFQGNSMQCNRFFSCQRKKMNQVKVRGRMPKKQVAFNLKWNDNATCCHLLKLSRALLSNRWWQSLFFLRGTTMELLMTKDAPAILLQASSISYDCHRPNFSVSKNLPLSCQLNFNTHGKNYSVSMALADCYCMPSKCQWKGWNIEIKACV